MREEISFDIPSLTEISEISLDDLRNRQLSICQNAILKDANSFILSVKMLEALFPELEDNEEYKAKVNQKFSFLLQKFGEAKYYKDPETRLIVDCELCFEKLKLIVSLLEGKNGQND